MAGKKKQDVGFDPLGWMFTFSDLVTLLLTFFVMLLSMKQPEVLKFQAAFGVFSGGGSTGVMTLTDQPGVQAHRRIMEQLETAAPADLDQARQELAEMMELPSGQIDLAGSLQQGVQVRQEPRGTVVTLANDLLFAPGKAELSPQAVESIKKIASVLSHGSANISVEGHTDASAPGAGSGFGDNWSLSLARAHAVLLKLIDPGGLKPDRLRLAALGDSRPLVPNDTPQRRAMNRRTEIVVLAQPKP